MKELAVEAPGNAPSRTSRPATARRTRAVQREPFAVFDAWEWPTRDFGASGLLEDLAALVNASLIAPVRDGDELRFVAVEPVGSGRGDPSASQGR
jgi:hypothetical protein